MSNMNSQLSTLLWWLKLHRSMPGTRISHAAPHAVALVVQNTNRAMATLSLPMHAVSTSYTACTRAPLARAAFQGADGDPTDSTHTARDCASATRAATPRSTRLDPQISD